MLPKEFLDRMKAILQEEYPLFIESFEKKHWQSLRLNPAKIDRELFLQKAPFSLSPVAWEENGFYYEDADQPGRHPWHEAGVYYVQEASAMAPVGYLDVQPGQYVLDLCAAPGGKSTQIAAAMKGEGLLVANEIHPARAKILSENVERMGVKNALVTNETPDKLAAHFGPYFDRILVDAPCSGEGMFRKHEEACEEWSPENVQICAERQDMILDSAAQMLRAGGRMVYSTCTFAPAEDEGSISRFLERHPEFTLVETEKKGGMENGRSQWAENLCEGIEKTIRLWPHKVQGEGHYLAVLQKQGSVPDSYKARCVSGTEKGSGSKDCAGFDDFCKEVLTQQAEKACRDGIFLKFGEQLYLAHREMPSLKGLKVLRPGLHLGTMKKNRFEPSHALALFLKAEDVRNSLDFSLDSQELSQYLNGMTLYAEGEKGWHLILADGCSIGWGKLAGGIMKNHYPRGLRKNGVF